MNRQNPYTRPATRAPQKKNNAPSSRSVPRSRSMPLLLMAGLLIVMGVILQAVRLAVWEEPAPQKVDEIISLKSNNTAKPEASTDKKTKGNVFDELYQHYPEHKIKAAQARKGNAQKEAESPVQKAVPLFPHNPVIGAYNAHITVAVFVDNACTQCRQQFKALIETLKPYEKSVRIAVKFSPKVDSEITAGLFAQMARREGVYTTYLNSLLNEGYVSDETYFMLLEKAGVSLPRQREMMTDDIRSLTYDLQKDISQFKELEFPKERNAVKRSDRNINKDGFVVYLNGYRMGAAGLDLGNIEHYIHRLNQGESLAEGF